MTHTPNYVEILRLYEAGFSLRQIAKLVSSGRNTVTRTAKIAQEKELFYEEIAQWSSEELEKMFKPDKDNRDQPVAYYVMPDYKKLSKELAKPGAYSTNEDHLPEESKNYGKWNSTRYLEWARRIGPNVHIVISRMFDQGPEQQYYRRVHAILKMADTYSDQRLDKACHYALERSTHPNFKLIKQLIESSITQADFNTSNQDEQSYLRGADYYDQFNRKN